MRLKFNKFLLFHLLLFAYNFFFGNQVKDMRGGARRTIMRRTDVSQGRGDFSINPVGLGIGWQAVNRYLERQKEHTPCFDKPAGRDLFGGWKRK